MPTCKACDKPIEVKWVMPHGATNARMEELCYNCLVWADIARQKGNVQPPNARRKPRSVKDEEDG